MDLPSLDEQVLDQIRRCTAQERDDATAVAYLAIASGKNARNAVRRFRKREGRYHNSKRNRDLSNYDSHPIARQKSVRTQSMLRDTDAR